MASTPQRSSNQRGFFTVVAEAQTWRNLIFLLLVAPLGALHGGLILAGGIALAAIAGVALSIGLPVGLLVLALIAPAIGVGLVVIHYLLQVQATVNQRLLGTPAPRSTLDELDPGSAFAWCAARLGDRRTWLGLLYLLVITAFGMLATTIVILVVGVSASLVYEALRGDVGAVDLALGGDPGGGDPLGIPGARFLMVLVAPLLALGGLHAANIMSGVAARLGNLLLGACPRSVTCHQSHALPHPPLTAYPRPGRAVGGHGD